MKPHNRVLLFCVVLLLAPMLVSVGETLAGWPGAVLLPSAATLASLVYAWLGGRSKPPLDSPAGR